MQKEKRTQEKLNFKERGITLIALIITIIVLLILAGVAIATLTGDSGILSNAEKAKENTEIANLKEEVGIKVMEYKIEPDKGIEAYLGKIPNAKVEKQREDTYYVTRGKTTLTVYEDGKKIEGKALWDGSSSSPEFKDLNWYIYNASQLKFLADYVNSGKVLTDDQKSQLRAAGYKPEDVKLTEETTVYLMNDLDLGAREVNGEWETEENEALQWTAIGKENTDDKKMVATFEGNGHTIRGGYINTDTNFNGIFGNSYSIKNLTIENSYIKGASGTAGIVGTLRKGTIENCHNINTTVTLIEGEYHTVGGVIGQASENTKVLNCSNTGKIVGNGIASTSGNTQAGGIVGLIAKYTTISNCYNTGKVESNGNCIGGIVGIASDSVTISNCNNKGVITGNGDNTGGVIGSANPLTTINNSYNEGVITGKGISTGGVVGNLEEQSTVSNSYNTGKVTSDGERTGGIVGNANPFVTISNCYNEGAVTGKVQYTGGIAGLMAQAGNVTNSKVEKCYNSGNVNGEAYTGGIVGYVAGTNGQGTVIQCYSKGQVTGTTFVGAVIGYQSNTTGLDTLNSLYYLSTVGIGAINGVDNESNKIMSTTDNLTSFKQFLEWIENK